MANAFQKFQQGRAEPAAASPAASRFGARPAAAATPGRGAVPRRKANKYAGLSAVGQHDRHPYPTPGDYLFKFVSSEESKVPGQNPYFKATFEVVISGSPNNPVGSLVAFSECVSEKAVDASGPRIKRMCMAFSGLDEGGYDEALGDEFMLACSGEADCRYVDGSPIPENPLAGQHAFARVTLGGPVMKTGADGKKTATGDHYRNYEWAIATEEEVAAAYAAAE
jgi:hypothetical protein